MYLSITTHLRPEEKTEGQNVLISSELPMKDTAYCTPPSVHQPLTRDHLDS